MAQGFEQIGKSMNLPPLAVLSGYIIVGSYMLSPSVVTIEDTDWNEPVLVWLLYACQQAVENQAFFIIIQYYMKYLP